MVIGANSMPTGIPSSGCSEERNYSVQNNSNVITAHSENGMALREPLGQAPLLLDSSALLYSSLLCAALGWSPLICSGETSSVFQFSQGVAVFSLWLKEKWWSSSQQETGLYGKESLPLTPDLFVLMQTRTPKPHNLIGTKCTVLICQNRAVAVG